jgi:hypothetical protein
MTTVIAAADDPNFACTKHDQFVRILERSTRVRLHSVGLPGSLRLGHEARQLADRARSGLLPVRALATTNGRKLPTSAQ